MAVQIMRKCAEGRSACAWTVRPTDGEAAYFLSQIIGLVQNMEKAQQGIALQPGFVRRILSASEDEQIRFIVQMTDALSS